MALLKNKYLEVFYEKESEVSNLLSNNSGKLHANVCIWECIWEREVKVGKKGMINGGNYKHWWIWLTGIWKFLVILTTFV